MEISPNSIAQIRQILNASFASQLTPGSLGDLSQSSGSAVVLRDFRGRVRSVGSHHLTDAGNARLLLSLFGEYIRFTPEKGWVCWNGRWWESDNGSIMHGLALQTVECLYRCAETATDEYDAEYFRNWAIESEAQGRLRAMVKLAALHPVVQAHFQDFDADPLLLNTRSGTIELRTGEHREHRREDYMMRVAGVHFVENATCPRWLTFLDTITNGNQDLIGYLKRVVGYCLTGLTTEQCLFFLFGSGRNGKSTFTEVLYALLDAYGAKINTDTLMVKRGSGIQSDIARLPGSRLVSAREVDEGGRLAEGLVKDLTGGDTIITRFMYREWFEFHPAFKLLIYGNHKPDIRGADDGIWRRIRLIPFEVTIPEDQVDPNLYETLKGELSGILNWAIEGCMEWQNCGLQEPPDVIAAVAEYRSEMDVLSDFLADSCEHEASLREDIRNIYSAYVGWCQRNGIAPKKRQWLSRQLTERGHEIYESNGVSYRLGLQLAEHARPSSHRTSLRISD